MSAERHALDAALNYAAKLEKEISMLRDQWQEERLRSAELRRKLNGVKDAVGCDTPRPMQSVMSQCENAPSENVLHGLDGYARQG